MKKTDIRVGRLYLAENRGKVKILAKGVPRPPRWPEDATGQLGCLAEVKPTERRPRAREIWVSYARVRMPWGVWVREVAERRAAEAVAKELDGRRWAWAAEMESRLNVALGVEETSPDYVWVSPDRGVRFSGGLIRLVCRALDVPLARRPKS